MGNCGRQLSYLQELWSAKVVLASVYAFTRFCVCVITSFIFVALITAQFLLSNAFVSFLPCVSVSFKKKKKFPWHSKGVKTYLPVVAVLTNSFPWSICDAVSSAGIWKDE